MGIIDRKMETKILSCQLDNLNESLARSKEALIHGEVLGFPTETVYGLAGNAFNENAIQKIFSTKERPTFDPLIVHIPAFETFDETKKYLSAQSIVQFEKISEKALSVLQKIITRFWPGPLTLILPKGNNISDLITAGLPTVAIRMPAHPIAQKILNSLSFPLAAPSANRFGKISPTCANDVLKELSNKIPFILDGGPCEIGLESTVVWLEPETGFLKILRAGKISQQELEKISPTKSNTPSNNLESQDFNETESLPSPGLLKSHYAPNIPLFLSTLTTQNMNNFIQKISEQTPVKKVGVLLFKTEIDKAKNIFEKYFNETKTTMPTLVFKKLPAQTDIESTARCFFQSMRELDEIKADWIFSEPCPTQTPLGYAIQSRLLKAATVTSTS